MEYIAVIEAAVDAADAKRRLRRIERQTGWVARWWRKGAWRVRVEVDATDADDAAEHLAGVLSRVSPGWRSTLRLVDVRHADRHLARGVPAGLGA